MISIISGVLSSAGAGSGAGCAAGPGAGSGAGAAVDIASRASRYTALLILINLIFAIGRALLFCPLS